MVAVTCNGLTKQGNDGESGNSTKNVLNDGEKMK